MIHPTKNKHTHSPERSRYNGANLPVVPPPLRTSGMHNGGHCECVYLAPVLLVVLYALFIQPSKQAYMVGAALHPSCVGEEGGITDHWSLHNGRGAPVLGRMCGIPV